ncbi:hypothetical protein SShM2_084 [Synechococcus phage S-ShM2]|uniref:Uncharacterized protein n=3 Tax=Ahtivirus sagseatwo TaxID=2734079 RepID=A0A1D7SIQ9_9CAUD|nr:hypothetical protein SShM2_084 [Synechococcus phage S-ShM2]AGH57263.1 hypothetical protein CPLG_00009 [Cyanophage S-SSM2]AOO13193.1 hypothetical protein LIS021110_079 [Cyanophage S-RIM14]ADO97695.1 hypothetical protein SShM2_084 [Synechococcus phage S-ShM2]AOO13409.1 hypothetical protein LIS110610_079 [Cyanophage S-RIM14]AOO13625.1 hypothetical protein Np111211_079 [Cyanophage S-RIM14]
MDNAIREERRDGRTMVLETLIRFENFLDPRMYACADYLVSAGLYTESSHIIQGWNEWKDENPTDNPQVNNRL